MTEQQRELLERAKKATAHRIHQAAAEGAHHVNGKALLRELEAELGAPVTGMVKYDLAKHLGQNLGCVGAWSCGWSLALRRSA